MEILPNITIQHYLWLSTTLFALGVFGVLLRRNAILMFMCIELMLNAVNIALVAFRKCTATHQDRYSYFSLWWLPLQK